MAYSEKVIDHYNQPAERRVPRQGLRKNVGTGIVGAPECGDVMKLQIQVDDDGNITDAKFKTYGCGSAIASSSLATEWLKGATDRRGAESIKNTQIVEELSLPPVKIHCSVLAEDAIKAAIDDYHSRSSHDADETADLQRGRGCEPDHRSDDQRHVSTCSATEHADHRDRFGRRGTEGHAGELPCRSTRPTCASGRRAAAARASRTCFDFDLRTARPNTTSRSREHGVRIVIDKKSEFFMGGTIGRLQRRPAGPRLRVPEPVGASGSVRLRHVVLRLTSEPRSRDRIHSPAPSRRSACRHAWISRATRSSERYHRAVSGHCHPDHNVGLGATRRKRPAS